MLEGWGTQLGLLPLRVWLLPNACRRPEVSQPILPSPQRHPDGGKKGRVLHTRAKERDVAKIQGLGKNEVI